MINNPRQATANTALGQRGAEKPWAIIPFIYHNEDYPGQKDNFVRTSRYTWLSFIPMTLMENFRNLTNVYFLLILLMSFFPYSPVSWVFNFIPLIFVLAVSMAKSGVEDWMKKKQDEINNSNLVKVYDYGEWRDKPSKDIRVGDIFLVASGQTIPADMLYLTSSNPNKTCNFSETNLNGESAIKTMSQHPAFQGLDIPKCFTRNQYYVSVLPPSKDLYKFNATLSMKNEKWPVSIKNILLKGCTMHFNDWIIGVAIRTGHDCTIMQNQRTSPAKSTEFDTNVNKMIILIFAFKMCLVLALSIANMIMENKETVVALIKDTYAVSFFKGFMQYFVIFSYMIPISLMVTIELIRVFHMVIIRFDYNMYDNEYGNAELRNTNMIVSLASVTHVLSDKTGTLTENVMHLVNFVDVNGSIAAVPFLDDIKVEPGLVDQSIELFRAMSICNTVIVYHNPQGIIEYNSESPDESSFVKYTELVGVALADRQPDKIVVDNRGEIEEYDVVSQIPFDSERKRMTVVVRKKGESQLVVYSKGADSIMYMRAKDSDKSLYLEEVNDFAVNGFRTLVFCKRVLTEEESNQWLQMYREAELNMENRESEILRISDFVENQFDVVGVTAVEDKLQDDVPDSILWLRQAKISVWVLTGDKLETAMEIGRTSSVIIPNSDALVLAQPEEENFVRQLEDYARNFDSFYEPVLVLTAETTKLAFKHEELFMTVAMKCRSVIFSRVSPFMKANIVRLVKKQPGTVTLAIGDGANDVGMIQEAHIGVGINGREGCQASQTADISLPRFRHLIRLIAIHGTWAFSRLDLVSTYMLYKNFVFILILLWCAFDTCASPPSFYNSFYITCFNLLFTLLPPFAYGFFEQSLPQATLIKYPQLHGSERTSMKFPRLTYYLLIAVYQSVAIYASVRFSHQDEAFESNGNLCYYCVVYVVTIQLMFWTRHYNSFVIGSFVLTFVILHFVTWFYSTVIEPEISSATLVIYTSAKSWFSLMQAVIYAVIPPFVVEYFDSQLHPSLGRLLRERESIDSEGPIDFAESLRKHNTVVGLGSSQLIYLNNTTSGRTACEEESETRAENELPDNENTGEELSDVSINDTSE